jgi:glycosyltransferase involved in cell wall biosynthesis
MKLIFINRFFYPDHSATSQILSDLAFFLSTRGHPVQVITSRLGYGEQNETLPKSESIKGVDVRRVWSTGFGSQSMFGKMLDYMTFYISAVWFLLRSVKKEDIVIVKTDPPLMSVATSWVTRWRGARQVNWIQDLFPEIAVSSGIRGVSGIFAKWLQQLRNQSLNAAEVNVVLGELMRARLLQEDVAPGRISIIHNWVDGESIQPLLNEDSLLREEWGLAGKFVVGYSGNLGLAHEIETVLSAAELLRHDQGVCFLFVGGGSQLKLLKDEVAKRSLQNFVFQVYQPREMMSQSLAAADVHLTILRPELEGLIVPSKIYGIFAAGRATLFIGDADGEVARMLREADAGVTVATGDGEAMVRQIHKMRTNPAELARMGINARNTFDERFAAQKAFAQWEAVLKP